MATLEEESDLPGKPAGVGAAQGGDMAGCQPAGVVPLGHLAPREAQGPELDMGRSGGEGHEVRPCLQPLYQPLEPNQGNRPLRGEPPAPISGPGAQPITPIQRAIADAHLADQTLPKSQIARNMGVSAAAVTKALDKPAVRMYLSQHLDAAGATLEKAARVISEAQDAHQVEKIRDSDSGTVEVVESSVPDHEVRLKGAKLALEGHGALEQPGQQVNIYQGLTDEQLAAIACGQAKVADFIDLRPMA